MELEADLQMAVRVDARRVHVGRGEDQLRPGREELSALGIEVVGISSQFMDGPYRADASRLSIIAPIAHRPHHVVEGIEATHRLADGTRIEVIDLLDLDRRDIAVLRSCRWAPHQDAPTNQVVALSRRPSVMTRSGRALRSPTHLRR